MTRSWTEGGACKYESREYDSLFVVDTFVKELLIYQQAIVELKGAAYSHLAWTQAAPENRSGMALAGCGYAVEM
jgi:hypothetical protein